MASGPVVNRRSADRRTRQDHHGFERRSGTDRRVAAESIRAPEPRDRPGLLTWLIIALVGILLVDAFVWHGHYRRSVLESISAEGAAIRTWSNDAWRSAGV